VRPVPNKYESSCMVVGSDRIVKVLTSVSWGSYYFEDLARIRRDLLPTSERYHTPTEHGSYPKVRTPVPAVSIGLMLANGVVAWGDCVPVSFSGKSGRALPRDPQELARWMETTLGPWFEQRLVVPWIVLEKDFLREFSEIPAFVRYGVSQAMVSAAVLAAGKPYWQIFAEDLGYQNPTETIRLHGSCGGDWGDTVDRMLARRLEYLPQGQFEFLDRQIGTDGKSLELWVESFKERAKRFGYLPTLTLDFHGALDELCNQNLERVADMIENIAKTAAPHPCHIESPLAAPDFEVFKRRIFQLKEILNKRGLHAPTLRIVADEWANSLSDIMQLIAENGVDGVHIKMPDTGALSECAMAVDVIRIAGKFALLGGSCTETMLGAKSTAHLAVVTRPDAVLVKPGMGFDESFAYLDGEMKRAIAEALNYNHPRSVTEFGRSRDVLRKSQVNSQ
jgi:methylaspartate ammonia-lyase